ncbi:MAG TPA: hypothetical protein VJ750_03145 [Rhizomicrobium sp.]|nr:hypothetical protein [Rhizomicrobium sp.]
MRIVSAVTLFVLVCCGVVAAQEFRGPPWFSAARCTRAISDAADRDLDRLKSWAAVYRTFRLYRQCDDGGIAAGYSDTVAILLTEHWSDVTELSDLSKSHPLFERFVLRHIDGLMSPEQSQLIKENARNRCPAGAKRLCRLLEKAVDEIN